MKTKIIAMLAIGISVMLVSCKENPLSNNQNLNLESANPVLDSITLIKKGNHLVNTIGCNECHSPKIMTERGPIPDPDRLLSGHVANEILPNYNIETNKNYVLFNMNGTAAIGPWGTTFAANLTPDDTGIGTWTEMQFKNAMKHGKYRGLEGSRQLLPPMPWQGYSELSDEDLKAIFLYLRSIKPVENIVPLAIPPTPF